MKLADLCNIEDVLKKSVAFKGHVSLEAIARAQKSVRAEIMRREHVRISRAASK